MTSSQAYDALTSRTDVRISRNLADRALLSAQTYGYYGIETPSGATVQIRFTDGEFTVK